MKIANFLNKFSKDDSLNHIVQKLCESAITITKGIHNDDYKIEQTTKNIDGDTQKPLDIFSDRTLLNSLKVKDVAGYCSEEQEGLVSINEDGKFVVVTDPLDGSSNIEAKTLHTHPDGEWRLGLAISAAASRRGCHRDPSPKAWVSVRMKVRVRVRLKVRAGEMRAWG